MTTTPDHHNDGGRRLSVADHQQGKTRVLARQCATCIFRPGDPMHLAPGRLSEMVTHARRTEGYIICHDTLPYGNHPHTPPAVCRGFYDRYTTLSLQLARRLWGIVEVEPPDQTSPPAPRTADRDHREATHQPPRVLTEPGPGPATTTPNPNPHRREEPT